MFKDYIDKKSVTIYLTSKRNSTVKKYDGYSDKLDCYFWPQDSFTNIKSTSIIKSCIHVYLNFNQYAFQFISDIFFINCAGV